MSPAPHTEKPAAPATAAPGEASPARLFALLVGISDYHPESGVRNLRGCVNDVRAAGRLLTDNFGVPAGNILTLVNEAASHAAIKQAFRSHLIARADEFLRNRADGLQEEAPAFLFYYSGHGSQARDLTGQEPDGMDETLVAWDSRTPGVFDIRDWELGALIEELNRATTNVSVILDACHSGSGTRDDEVAPARACPPDLRLPPTQRPVADAAAGGERGITWSNWELAQAHVLLAGCKDRELARELSLPSGESEGDGLEWRGAMSYFFQQVLSELPPQRTLTWRDLHEQVRQRVGAVYSNQTPQCEGALDRPFLGGISLQRPRFFTVTAEQDGLLWVDAGIVHGVRAGSLFRTFAPQTRSRAEPIQSLATLAVVREAVDRSGCVIVEEGRTVPLLARAEIERLSHGLPQRIVRLDIEEPALRAALASRLAAQSGVEDVSAFVRPLIEESSAAAASSGPTVAAEDLRVTHDGAALFIADRGGAPLAGPYAPAEVEEITLDLAHIARYRNALDLRNEDPAAPLLGALSMEFKLLVFDESTGKPVGAPLPRGESGDALVESGKRLVIEITNNGDKPLYLGLFYFSPDQQIALIWPQVEGAHEALTPGKTLALGRSARADRQITAELPPGSVEALETYKLFAAVADVNYELMGQGPLRKPFSPPKAAGTGDADPSQLDLLLAQSMGAAGLKDAPQLTGSAPADQWTTLVSRLRIVAPAPDSLKQAAPAGAPVDPGPFLLGVEPPPNFDGRVRVLTETMAALRAPRGGGLPPGLAPFPELFQPYSLRPLRASLPAGETIEVECDERARAAVTPQSPLRLRLPAQEEGAGLLALAHDGAAWFVVGQASAGEETLDVEWLPRPDAPDESAVRSERGLGRIVRLYLYRVMGEAAPQLGLFGVRFVPDAWLDSASSATFTRRVPGGQLRYTPAPRPRANERIALILHGFGDDSASEANWLCRTLAEGGLRYDRVLCFEYESYATPILTNAAKLDELLGKNGLDANAGMKVDLYAHSMGALIARWYIERMGGDALVERSLFAAPPNQGTPLASVAMLTPWLAALAVNLPAPSPSSLLIAYALGLVAVDGAGPADLRPRSAFLQELAAGETKAQVRYHVLAGDAAASPLSAELSDRLLRKLADGLQVGAGWFFDGDNDLVVSVRSSLGLSVGKLPGSVLLTRIVPSSHFAYFENDAATQQVLRWLAPPVDEAPPPEEAPPAPRKVRAGERPRHVVHFARPRKKA